MSMNNVTDIGTARPGNATPADPVPALLLNLTAQIEACTDALKGVLAMQNAVQAQIALQAVLLRAMSDMIATLQTGKEPP